MSSPVSRPRHGARHAALIPPLLSAPPTRPVQTRSMLKTWRKAANDFTWVGDLSMHAALPQIESPQLGCMDVSVSASPRSS